MPRSFLIKKTGTVSERRAASLGFDGWGSASRHRAPEHTSAWEQEAMTFTEVTEPCLYAATPYTPLPPSVTPIDLSQVHSSELPSHPDGKSNII